MKKENETFSQRVKNELALLPCSSEMCQKIELAAAFWAAGKAAGDGIVLTTAHRAFAERISELLARRYQITPEIRRGSEKITLNLKKDIFGSLQQDIESFSYCLKQPADLNLKEQQALLRALFLACGSLNDPRLAYHLELAVRQDEQKGRLLNDFLLQLGFNNKRIRRAYQTIIYLREGQDVSDFLLMAGAHQSLLAFESLRVEKEMRNTVNRVVNCDNANLQRVANATARQISLLGAIDQMGLSAGLPAGILAAARLRSDNPELSLAELGQQMDPPLGKSGMYHRLKRFEERAFDLLGREKD